jgi:hypothetical protein
MLGNARIRQNRHDWLAIIEIPGKTSNIAHLILEIITLLLPDKKAF